MPKNFDVELDSDQLQAQVEHLKQGGLFVPQGDAALELMSEVRVRLKTPNGRAEVDAQVVQVIPGGGVGLMVDPEEAKAKIEPLLSRTPHPESTRTVDNVALRVQRMTSDEKRDLAKHGDRAARMALVKDTNKAIHMYVLQNQHLTSDELRLMAAQRNINPQVLSKIAQNRTWMRDKGLVMAMVSNPKTPPAIAKRALERLTFMELRRLVKMGDIPPRIVIEAKERLKRMKH